MLFQAQTEREHDVVARRRLANADEWLEARRVVSHLKTKADATHSQFTARRDVTRNVVRGVCIE